MPFLALCELNGGDKMPCWFSGRPTAHEHRYTSELFTPETMLGRWSSSGFSGSLESI